MCSQHDPSIWRVTASAAGLLASRDMPCVLATEQIAQPTRSGPRLEEDLAADGNWCRNLMPTRRRRFQNSGKDFLNPCAVRYRSVSVDLPSGLNLI